ncbi:hypothetical protein K438DRAFT_1835293, partial [Mycena galopus ATCC 62051]
PAAADTTAAAPASGDFANASTLQAIQDLLASPEFRSLGDSFDPASPLFEDSGAASPLFEDNSGSFDIDNYLTSPMETPYDDFATSPADDSPFSDFINTPVLSMAPKSTASLPSPAVDAASTRRRATVTGTRKNLKPEALIPLEAPTQKRTYLTPSATSRKAVPAVFQKKRQHSVAFAGDADDLEELGVLSPTASEAETIEYKRRQNTLAARKSRKRKLEHQRELEEQVETLQGEVELWKGRALTMQNALIGNGVPFTPWED